jgi:hypothetical protein
MSQERGIPGRSFLKVAVAGKVACAATSARCCRAGSD